MEKIIVHVSWFEKNFGAALDDKVPGADVLTAKTFEDVQEAVPETLRFHVEGLLEDEDDVYSRKKAMFRHDGEVAEAEDKAEVKAEAKAEPQKDEPKKEEPKAEVKKEAKAEVKAKPNSNKPKGKKKGKK